MPAKAKDASAKLHGHWPAASVEMWSIERVFPHARNSRTHGERQVEMIAASMREWGWTAPCLVNEGGELIAGHGRVLAAQRLGLKDIPVMVARGWSEAKQRAYRIADNRLAEVSDWDEEMLVAEIADLQREGFDLDLTGFSDDEITALLTPPETAPDDFDEHDEEIETEHECPKCGFRFSGGAKAKA